MDTTTLPLDPLAPIPLDPVLRALPKADIHVHQEWSPRLDRVLARRAGRTGYDWRAWASELMAQVAPGMPRLERLATVFPAAPADDVPPENTIARLEDLLEEGAADGALLVELRLGSTTAVQHPDFMALVHEAERRVRDRHPGFHAAASYTLLMWAEPELLERVVAACLRAADEGLAGLDLLYTPYDAEADWQPIYQVARRAADAGLGVTAHVGEMSTANIAAALRTPGLTRLGHATYAARDPRLLDLLAASGVTVECCLSSNVVLGAVPSYETHPIRAYVERGIPVALCTDDPVQLCTTIGREYAIARALGFTPAELLGFSANALRAAFVPSDTKAALLAELDAWARAHLGAGARPPLD